MGKAHRGPAIPWWCAERSMPGPSASRRCCISRHYNSSDAWRARRWRVRAARSRRRRDRVWRRLDADLSSTGIRYRATNGFFSFIILAVVVVVVSFSSLFPMDAIIVEKGFCIHGRSPVRLYKRSDFLPNLTLNASLTDRGKTRDLIAKRRFVGCSTRFFVFRWFEKKWE